MMRAGRRSRAAESHAEYKQVTVLFADVVALDGHRGGRRRRNGLREIMSEVFRRSSLIVQRYGGTVDKFTGDGIMAVFGAPVALEDHAHAHAARHWTFRRTSRRWPTSRTPRQHHVCGCGSG